MVFSTIRPIKNGQIKLSDHVCSYYSVKINYGCCNLGIATKGTALILVVVAIICYPTRMRILGIDYGSKRVGIALTNEDGTMAFPREVLPNDTKLQGKIEAIIAKEHVDEIVIGHSLDRDGQPNKIHEAVEELMMDLTLSVGLPIHLMPEQYTTQAALRTQGRNDLTDASAAALILDAFITKPK